MMLTYKTVKKNMHNLNDEAHGYGSFIGSWATNQQPFPGEKMVPLHNSHRFPIIPQLGVGPRGTLSYPCPYVDGLDLLKGFRR